MKQRVAFVGLGNIGKPMAINLARSGEADLMVYDVQPQPLEELVGMGAKTAGSLRQIGLHGGIIELVVVDDSQVENCILGADGLLSTAAGGSVIVIHSTVHPRTVHKIAEFASPKGVDVIDAQLSGGARGVISKTLTMMCGGDKAVLERCRPVFKHSAANIFHLGPVGSGAIAKLANNLIVYMNLLAASEGIRLAEKGGLDLDVFEQVVAASSGQSRAAANWRKQRQLWNPDAKTDRPGRVPQIIHKDLRLALEFAHEVGLPLPGTALVQQMIDKFS